MSAGGGSREGTPRWRRYLRFVRPNVPADVDDELTFHIGMRIERNLALGMSADEARRDAVERFGDVEAVRMALVNHDQRNHTKRRRAEYVADLMQDLKFAARALRRAPGFTIAAVLTLALGIGANTAIFSVLNAVVLQPLPYAHPDRLVWLGWGSVGEYLSLKPRLHAITDLAAWEEVTDPVDDGHEALRLKGVAVTTNLLPLLGVAPMMGRNFTSSEGVPGNSNVIILSYGTWHRVFGGEAGILGRTVSINGTPTTVIGVMPPSFHYPSATTEYWMPYAIDPANVGLMWGVCCKSFVGRLAPNVPLDQARRELRIVWPTLRKLNPLWDPGANYKKDANVTPLKTNLVGAGGSLLWMLFGATLLVLLIACVNVANLLLARATVRARELAVRAALGGGRGRLLRQLVTEGVLLSTLGAVLGVGVALLAVKVLTASVPAGMPRIGEVSISATVLGFTLLVSFATGIVFSLVPAIRATSSTASASSATFGRRTTFGASHARVAGLLVAGEVALAVMLVVASLLLLRSFAAERSIAPGFDPTHVVAARLTVPRGRYASDTARLGRLYEDVLGGTRSLPGVRDAALVDRLPLAEPLYGQAIRVQGQFEDINYTLPFIDHSLTVTPEYFATMGIPVTRGRAFTDADREGQVPVAIISQSLAMKYWPKGDAVGHGIGYPFKSPWITIVGVVPDTKGDSLRDTSRATLYFPWAQRRRQTGTQLWLVARTSGDPAAAGAELRSVVHRFDPSVPVTDVRAMSAVVDESVTGSRFIAAVVTAFALLAFALGGVGIYGVMSYLVSERAREMGIRMALGGSAGAVMRLVVARALQLAVIGSVIGLGGAMLAARPLRRWLYGVSPTDPITAAAVPVLFIALALLASYAPALRATRADPAAALREE